jgi:predicted DNA-binding transcriptional regulator YafY
MCAAICRAIQTRTLLAFDYDGHHRIIEPYCHGTGTVGQELLRAYQVAGDSSTGRLGWKLFDVSRITEMRAINEHFTARPDYNPADALMHPVHCGI